MEENSNNTDKDEEEVDFDDNYDHLSQLQAKRKL